MPEFHQNLITEKSFKILQDLKREFKFILIGGWAIFLYTKALKLKDIDWNFYGEFLRKHGLGNFKRELAKLLNETSKAPELGLNEYLFSKLRKSVLDAISEKTK